MGIWPVTSQLRLLEKRFTTLMRKHRTFAIDGRASITVASGYCRSVYDENGQSHRRSPAASDATSTPPEIHRLSYLARRTGANGYPSLFARLRQGLCVPCCAQSIAGACMFVAILSAARDRSWLQG